jgi:hypothetical protein
VTTPRPIALVRHELASALAYQQRYESRHSDDQWAVRMREDNEREVERLRAELTLALSADLELSIEGVPVEDHRISVPYFNRVLESLQATYRAVLKSMSPDHLRRAEVTLSVAGTAPGSFKVLLKAPPAQLELIDEPLVDRGMGQIVDLLQAAQAGTIDQVGPAWASRADEPEVRAMIRLAATLAASRGTTHLRWLAVGGTERMVSLSAAAARSLTLALAGEVGREILTVTGHLEMAQDRPPRVRVRTDDDEYIASVKDSEMLERVKSLLFEEVEATLVVDIRTSPTTGIPDTNVELLDLERA